MIRSHHLRDPHAKGWRTVVIALVIFLGLNAVQSLASVPPTEVGAFPSALAIVSYTPDLTIPKGVSGVATSGPNGTSSSDGATSGAAYWTNLSPPTAPSSRYLASMTYDGMDHYDLLFGGQWNATMNDTWTFANGVWTNITSTAGTPPPTQPGMVMTYDAADGYVLAWGCPGANPNASAMCNDTWSFSHGKWSKIAAVVEAPAGGWSGLIPGPSALNNLVYDATDSYVVLTDGAATWKYSGGVWTPFCAPSTNCTRSISGPPVGAVAYDAYDGYVLSFGSRVGCSGCDAFGGYTWKFSGGIWSNITASAGTPPPARFISSAVYDNSSGGVLLFGGSGYKGQPLNDTWLFQNGTWRNVSASRSPQARYEGSIAYDPADSGVVVFGGIGGVGTTWMWGNDPPIAGLAVRATPPTPLPGANVSFTASFMGGVGSYSYSWRFGDGSSSSAVNPTHVYGTEGTYVARLWVNDSAGHAANTSLRVHIYLPLALLSLQATPNPANLGQPVNFTTVAAGGTPPYTFSWVFGDGGTGGNLSNITHIYTTNGPFTVVVAVVDALGAAARSTLNLSIKLEALAGSTTSVGAPPLTVNFVGQAQGGISPYHYDWSFGDGETSILQNPRHTYNSSGQFTVVLTILDSRNDRSTSTLTIQVGPSATGGSGLPAWVTDIVIAGTVSVGLGAVWGASSLYQRSRRQQGEQWIEELTREPESQKRGPNP